VITDQDIEDALDEVSDDEIEKRLAEEDCFLYSLATAIVHVKCYGGDAANLTAALDACMNAAERIKQELAMPIARGKDDARRFGADTHDSFDDYQWRTA
jgi:hypothetical protein